MPNQAVIPNEGKPGLLTYLLGPWGTEPNPWSLRLFKNNYVPVAASVLADFEECDFVGYVPQTLFRSEWQTPTLAIDTAVSIWGTAPIEFGGPATPQIVYGVIYTDDDLNLVRFAYRFDAPFTIETANDLRIIPQFTFGSFIPC